ncbi:hypothetical protein HPB47_018110 [Ixodes persulcatus]|uniref:Uncharacterized protein n=1 Tax=Ixodes persulcatus TaxID=34615 RepID=A0AC60QZW3_IXOPE|nr:hypothetical protein HPB47_018110 [Ixodes persulcatus]
MGRKRKAPDDYSKEFDDFDVCTDPSPVVCKYSMEECITRVSRKTDEVNDVAQKFCKAGVLSKTSRHLGDIVRSICPAARTTPSAQMIYLKYLPDVFDKELSVLRELCENRPIFLTIDETRNFIADLQLIQKCNTVAVGVLVQEVLGKLRKSFRYVYVVSSDSASYMYKLHKDIQLYHAEFMALHFKEPCHLLNITLSEGLKLVEFNVVQNFVVYCPALLKSSRKLRRRFNIKAKALYVSALSRLQSP